METRTDILNELKQLSPFLAESAKMNVFTVPVGYFETFANDVLINVKDEIGFAKDIPKYFLPEVPEGYFNNLAGNILDKIKAQQKETAADELRHLSPMLYSIQGENVFEVPKGYFNDLADTVLNKVQPGKKKVSVMPIRRTIFRYASAAIVLGFVTLSIFKFTGTQPSAVKTIASTVAVALNPSILQGKNMNDKQFNDALNNLSEDDIASYLEKNGNESDIAELESNIDDNNLPSQDDYLLDDKTLENYLSDNVKQADN